MTGRTHLLAGFAAGVALASIAGAPPVTMGAMAVVAGIAALLPDIDHPQSMLSGWPLLGIVSRLLSIGIRHRGPTHSGLAIALVAAVMLAVAAPPEFIISAVAGYASHLALDALTVAGVPLLWPLGWRLRVMPYWANGIVWAMDGLIAAAACAAIGVMLWSLV